MKIYNNPMSSNCKRVFVTAYELGLDPERAVLDMSEGEHRTAEYRALNPMGKVPTMVDEDGFTLWESSSIAWYLAECNPSKGLLPPDLKARADQMRWMFWNACHLEPAVHGLVMERWIKPNLMKQEGDEARCEVLTRDVERFLPILNGALEGRAWLGERCSLADVCLGITVEEAANVKVDTAAYAHVVAWLGRLQSRPSWKKASGR